MPVAGPTNVPAFNVSNESNQIYGARQVDVNLQDIEGQQDDNNIWKTFAFRKSSLD